ncbi:superfamily II DNA/RNA helicase [Clostridium beijerinckii]|nr:superfamily II DNA/RNA helicase [Clostridium beijerinckii]
MIKANFNDYKLCNELLKAISMLNFNELTKVQEQVIPIALEEKDIVVKSKTGSGKTASYAIPICQLVDWEENKPQALVITPTRELAIQVKEDFFNIGRFKRIKAAAIYGKSLSMIKKRNLNKKHI